MKSNNIPNLTPLRFFLAVFVILYHVYIFCKLQHLPYFDLLGIFHKGLESVYVFFTLSGFLIIRQLYAEKKGTGTIRLKRFYLKRVFRILPLYYLVLFFGLFHYRVLLPYLGFPVENNYNFLEGLLLSVTLFANVFFTFSPGGVIEVLWSIAIEEQFYLLIAPLFRSVPVKRIALFLVLFSVGYYLLYFFSPLTFLSKYSMLFFYFTLGGLVGVWLDRPFFISFIRNVRFTVFGFVAVYFATTFFFDRMSLPAYHLFSSVLFALFVGSLALFPFRLLEHKFFYFLGNISFGMYMLHQIVMQGVGLVFLKFVKLQSGELTFVLMNVLTVTGAVGIAYLSKRYYENFFMKMREKYI